MRIVAGASLALAILLGVSAPAVAQEAAKYNFASVQGNKHISVAPGGEGRAVLYFYNIDGNRITHITLDVSQAPAGWEVRVEPARHEITANVGGREVKVAENLHVAPSQLLLQEAREVPEGMVCIPIPGRGYALAKAAHVVVRVPEAEEIGAKGDIRVSAEAAWLGQSGAAAIKQVRDFDFSVAVAAQNDAFSETIIVEPGEPEGYGAFLARWLPTIAAGAIVLLGAIVIPALATRRRAEP